MPEISEDLFFAPIPELNERLKAQEFKSRDFLKACLQRLDTIGKRLNAVALTLPKDAEDLAKDVDDEFKLERHRGPLQGIPYGAKDLLAVKESTTAWGAQPFATQVPDADSRIVAKLKSAKALLAAKLSMVELAGGGGYRYASASVTGPGLNPWNVDRWAGGSSSGSAAAVAAGLVPFAIGSETWGSILTPSAFCGVTGLRPTYGLVSRSGAMPLSWTMDKIGPICRNAEDCGLVLREISGGDDDDLGSAGKSFYYTPQFARKFEDLRIGWAPVDFEQWPQESARKAFQDAFDVIRSVGTKVATLELPDFPYSIVARTVIAAEGSAVFEQLVRTGGVDQLADQRQIAGLKAGLDIYAADYLRAMRIRSEIQQEIRELYYDFDILVSPARFTTAPLVSEPLDASTRPDSSPTGRGLRDLGAAGNLAGLPALSIPCGFADGLPIALQLVGRPFTENNLIALGKEFQKRTDWHLRRPPVTSST